MDASNSQIVNIDRSNRKKKDGFWSQLDASFKYPYADHEHVQSHNDTHSSYLDSLLPTPNIEYVYKTKRSERVSIEDNDLTVNSRNKSSLTAKELEEYDINERKKKKRKKEHNKLMNYLKELKDIDDELLYFKESIYEEKLESLQEEIMTIKEGNRQDIRAKDKELEKIKDNALNSAHAMYKYQMGALESQYAQDKQAIEDEMNIQAGYIRRAIIANMIEEGSKKRFRFDNNTNDKDYNSFFSSHGNSTSSNHSSSTSRNHSSSTSRNHSNSSSNHGNSTSDNHVNPMAHNQKIAASNKQSITTINKHKSKTHHPNIHPHSHDNANKLKATQKDEYITPNNKYTYSKVSIKRKIDTLLAIADRRQTAHQRLERNTLDDIARASVDDIERDLIEMRRKY